MRATQCAVCLDTVHFGRQASKCLGKSSCCAWGEGACASPPKILSDGGGVFFSFLNSSSCSAFIFKLVVLVGGHYFSPVQEGVYTCCQLTSPIPCAKCLGLCELPAPFPSGWSLPASRLCAGSKGNVQMCFTHLSVAAWAKPGNLGRECLAVSFPLLRRGLAPGKG